LYGFVDARAPLPAVEGVEPDTPVFAIASDGVACVVSLVPARDYGQSGAARDEHWLAPRALRHHEVLSAVHRVTPVLPLRFGASCASGADVRALLADRQATLREKLSAFQGTDEWTLRMTADAGAIADRLERESPALIELRERAATLPDGRAYFVRKQRASTAAALASQALAAIEDDVIGRLGLPAVRGRRAVAGAFAEAALLVGRAGVDALKAALADLEAEQAWCGLRFAIVGPWPPYSFAPALDGN
jgi:hypothetical protein